MTKPPTSVRSIRLTDDLWAALQKQADLAGVKLNRYVADRLEPAGVDRMVETAQVLARGEGVGQQIVAAGGRDRAALAPRPWSGGHPKPGKTKR